MMPLLGQDCLFGNNMQNTNAKDIIMVWKERYDKKTAMGFLSE